MVRDAYTAVRRQTAIVVHLSPALDIQIPLNVFCNKTRVKICNSMENKTGKQHYEECPLPVLWRVQCVLLSIYRLNCRHALMFVINMNFHPSNPKMCLLSENTYHHQSVCILQS